MYAMGYNTTKKVCVGLGQTDEEGKKFAKFDDVVSKENTDEAKAFVKRMTDVATTLAALIKEADGESAKYGQDIVLLAAFTNAQKNFEGWIEGAEKKIEQGYPSPNNMEEATTMVNNCKEWMDQTTALGAALELGKANADKMTLHADQDALYTSMKARWVKVDEAAKEWTKKLD